MTDAELPPIIEAVFRDQLQLVEQRDVLPGFKDHTREAIVGLIGQDVSELIEALFGNLPISASAHELLVSICSETIRRHFFGPSQGGVVIAGFGQREFMPSLVSYELEEIVHDIPRAARIQNETIGDDTAAAVIPFAQKDMVQSFMEGIHEDLHEYLTTTTAGLFKGAIERVLNAVADRDQHLADSLRGVVESKVRTMLDQLFNDWEGRRQDYWQPVVEVVASLPKDELAAMAEALVNLTKFRRRISPLRETVGGPIDVAIITRGDGFVWIRRKHYFSSELNPRAIARLQNEAQQ